MAVHVPLSAEAQAEARLLMLSAHNILNPKDGRPVAVPTQDMVLGCYYLTADGKNAKGEGKCFKDFEEAIMAYENKVVDLHALVKVRCPDGSLITTTVGRVIFNEVLPKELGFINQVADKKTLSKIVDDCYRNLGFAATSALLDGIKKIGFTFSTKAGVTISLTDIVVPSEKQAILNSAEKEVEQVEQQYRPLLPR